MIREVQGDLFKGGAADNKAHCVAADLVMGRGIAVLFKQKYGQVGTLTTQLKQKAQQEQIFPHEFIGCLALQHDNGQEPPPDIYYLVTKARSWGKPTYHQLEKALLEMRRIMLARQKTSVSMPLIGCGLDQLKWLHVRQILERVFTPIVGIHVTIYRL